MPWIVPAIPLRRASWSVHLNSLIPELSGKISVRAITYNCFKPTGSSVQERLPKFIIGPNGVDMFSLCLRFHHSVASTKGV